MKLYCLINMVKKCGHCPSKWTVLAVNCKPLIILNLMLVLVKFNCQWWIEITDRGELDSGTFGLALIRFQSRRGKKKGQCSNDRIKE